MRGKEAIEEISRKLDAGEEVAPVTVRTLLSWFGAKRRGWYIVREIKLALAKHELFTNPFFDAAYIDSEIRFFKPTENLVPVVVIPTSAAPSIANSTTSTISASYGEEEDAYSTDPTYRISRLEAANKELVSVKPDNCLSEAITKMMTYDYSQLPVMQQSKRDLKGVISWRSIGSRLALCDLSGSIEDLKVRDVMETNFQLISNETSLFRALPMIIEHDYVLVENRAKELCGMVTASDLSLQFKQLAEPFLLVSEIENHIRYLLVKLPLNDLKAAKYEEDGNRQVDSIADLSFGEYVRLLENKETWNKLGLKLDRGTFCKDLSRVREIRNNIMHFDPDGLDEEDIDELRRCARLLQNLRGMNAV